MFPSLFLLPIIAHSIIHFFASLVGIYKGYFCQRKQTTGYNQSSLFFLILFLSCFFSILTPSLTLLPPHSLLQEAKIKKLLNFIFWIDRAPTIPLSPSSFFSHQRNIILLFGHFKGFSFFSFPSSILGTNSINTNLITSKTFKKKNK